MYKYHCLNPISPVGLEKFSSEYQETDNIQEADVVLVRSADMKSMDLPENLKAIGRAGATVLCLSGSRPFSASTWRITDSMAA